MASESARMHATLIEDWGASIATDYCQDENKIWRRNEPYPATQTFHSYKQLYAVRGGDGIVHSIK